MQPLVGGIYTADPAELSLKATLPQFPAMEREHGSLILGAIRQARKSRSAERGASGAALWPVRQPGRRDGHPPQRPARRPPASDRPDRDLGPADRPGRPEQALAGRAARRPADRGRRRDPDDRGARLRPADRRPRPELALQLRSIPYASSAIVTVAYPRDRVAHPLDGFGVVVPAVEGRSILAASFLSVKFPTRAPAGTALIRVFVGGATQPGLYDLDDDELKALVRAELASLLGVSGEPLLIGVARHDRAMPQYTLGHQGRIEAIRLRAAQHSRLILAGSAFNGVGIPDCVRSGQDAAAALLKALADPAAPAAA